MKQDIYPSLYIIDFLTLPSPLQYILQLSLPLNHRFFKFSQNLRCNSGLNQVIHAHCWRFSSMYFWYFYLGPRAGLFGTLELLELELLFLIFGRLSSMDLDIWFCLGEDCDDDWLELLETLDLVLFGVILDLVPWVSPPKKIYNCTFKNNNQGDKHCFFWQTYVKNRSPRINSKLHLLVHTTAYTCLWLAISKEYTLD